MPKELRCICNTLFLGFSEEIRHLPRNKSNQQKQSTKLGKIPNANYLYWYTYPIHNKLSQIDEQLFLTTVSKQGPMTNSGILVSGDSTKLSNLSVFFSAVPSALLCAPSMVFAPLLSCSPWVAQEPTKEVREQPQLSESQQDWTPAQCPDHTNTLPPLAGGKDQGFSHIIAPGRG